MQRAAAAQKLIEIANLKKREAEKAVELAKKQAEILAATKAGDEKKAHEEKVKLDKIYKEKMRFQNEAIEKKKKLHTTPDIAPNDTPWGMIAGGAFLLWMLASLNKGKKG